MRHPHPVIYWILLLSLGVAVLLPALSGFARHGWQAGLLGLLLGLLGVVGGLIVLICGGVGLLLCREFFRRGGPRFPPCENGTCRGRRWPSLRDRDLGEYTETMVEGETVLRCQCGLEYVARGGERRFLRRLADGTLRPYKVHRAYRGWEDDREGR